MPADTSDIDTSDLATRLDELRALAQKKDPTDAIYACDKFNRDYPLSGQGFNIASQLALRINDASAAIRAIDYALGIDPQRPEWLLQKANCLAKGGRQADARVLAKKMSERLYASAHLSSAVGLLLAHLDMHEEALVLFDEAVRQEPRVAGHYYNLATVQRFLGDLTAAESSLDAAIALDPADTDALSLRSGLRKQSRDNNHIPELKLALDRHENSPRTNVSICFALAKELEDVTDYKDSFQYLARGADTRREHINYDVGSDIDTMQRIRTVFDSGKFAGTNKGQVDASPIFVVGMPRTGTTLVERILGSHSVVKGAGELHNFALQLTNVARASTASPIQNRAELVAASGNLDTAVLGRAYVESCKSLAGSHAHFVDKMPMNFLYSGLIHLALPKAKIIHVVRDPMDTCYAVYKTLFEGAYPFSYDLQELARYYVAYHELMMHWERLMPGVMLQVQYEDLVADPTEQIHRILDYCGLSWEQQCIEFHRSGDYSTTASAAQIRQPVHQDSIGRWKCYEKELQPIVEILSRAAIAVSCE